jgi:N-acetylglutamate synthase-like GNAT family acetyltransferase
MSEISIEEAILNASELFHYAYRFRNSRFVISIPEPDQLEKLIPDLSVIQHARISTAIVTGYSRKNQLEIEKLHAAGSCFRAIVLTSASECPTRSEIDSILASGIIPIYLLKNSLLSSEIIFELPVVQLALKLARTLEAEKLFLTGEKSGLDLEGLFISAPQLKDIKEIVDRELPTNLDRQDLKTLTTIIERETFDVIILQSQTGSLFQEIFTHLGSGTLFSKHNSLLCRQAKLADVTDIVLLLKPAIRAGSVLTISESELIDQISNFYVYTSNTLIVASACLKNYGDCYEISKVCTFPRYQGRGLARGLIRELFKKAILDGKQYVFALSVNERMWGVFETLGFVQIEKSLLPADWFNNYDHSRPSRAYKKDLVA